MTTNRQQMGHLRRLLHRRPLPCSGRPGGVNRGGLRVTHHDTSRFRSSSNHYLKIMAVCTEMKISKNSNKSNKQSPKLKQLSVSQRQWQKTQIVSPLAASKPGDNIIQKYSRAQLGPHLILWEQLKTHIAFFLNGANNYHHNQNVI